MGKLSRITLGEALADELRREISAGTWTGRLPGYRVLGRSYGVSQPTCEAALAVLAAEGLVCLGGPRQPWRIKADCRVASRSGAHNIGKVLWLTEEDETRMDPTTLTALAAVRQECEANNGRLLLHIGKFLCSYRPEQTSARLLQRYQPDRVILHNAPARTVTAFHRSGLPIFMLGGERPAGVPIEGMGQSIRELFTNLVARMIRLGRRRLLSPLPAGREGWRDMAMEVMKNSGLATGDREIGLWAPAVRDDFPEAMTHFWRERLSKLRPDAVLVLDATWVVSLYGAAWEAGMRPGRDFLVVTTDSPELLRWLNPPPVLLRFRMKQIENCMRRWLHSPDPSRGFYFLKPRWPTMSQSI